MIDYQQFCQIKDLHEREGLKAAQIAGVLGLDPKTVAYWTSRRERATIGNKGMAISVLPYRTGTFPVFEPISGSLAPKIWRNYAGSCGSRKFLARLQSQYSSSIRSLLPDIGRSLP